jgi:hypothetical protein
MSHANQIAALEALKKSKGWQLVEQTMRDEVVAAALAIASNATMTEKEVDFRRGAIWAAQQFLNLPDRLKARLETDRALSREDDSSDQS